MSPDVELMLIFGTLHLIAIGFGALLLWMFLHSSETQEWRPPDDDDEGGGGGGGNDRVGPGPHTPAPRGGLPLPHARPAPFRLRSPGRLADLYDRPGRRPAHEPERAPQPTRR